MSKFSPLSKNLDSLIRHLASQATSPLSDLIRNIPEDIRSQRGTKNLRSSFSELLVNYKKNGHFGKLRVGLLLAVLFEGRLF